MARKSEERPEQPDRPPRRIHDFKAESVHRARTYLKTLIGYAKKAPPHHSDVEALAQEMRRFARDSIHDMGTVLRESIEKREKEDR